MKLQYQEANEDVSGGSSYVRAGGIPFHPRLTCFDAAEALPGVECDACASKAPNGYLCQLPSRFW